MNLRVDAAKAVTAAWPSSALIAATLAVLAATDPSAAAQPRDWTLVLGGGGVYTPDFEGSSRRQYRLMPFVEGSYKDAVLFSGGQLMVPVVHLGKGVFTAGFAAKTGAGRDEKDNRTALKGLGDIGPQVELGGYAELQLGPVAFGMTAGQDVAGGHKGYEVAAFADTSVALTKSLTLSLSGNTTWVSRKYMDSYFGITPAQSLASGLPTFSAKAGIKNVGVTGALNQRWSEHWSMTNGVHYSRLLNDAADNPLVRQRGSRNQTTSYMVVAYAL